MFDNTLRVKYGMTMQTNTYDSPMHKELTKLGKFVSSHQRRKQFIDTVPNQTYWHCHPSLNNKYVTSFRSLVGYFPNWYASMYWFYEEELVLLAIHRYQGVHKFIASERNLPLQRRISFIGLFEFIR